MSDNTRTQRLIAEYLEYLEIERQASKFTIRNYTHYLRRFCEWYERQGPKKIESLNTAAVKAYRLYLSRYVGPNNLTLSRVTQSYHVICLRSFLKWLIKNDYVVMAPEKIDLPKTESRSLTFLNGEQLRRLLTAPAIGTEAGLRDKALLEVLFSTGLRVSELVGLNRDTIDFERLEFGVIGKGKRARVVFMSKNAATWTKRYFAARIDQWKPAFVRYSRDMAELHEDGEKMRLSVRSVQRIVSKYARKARLPVHITPHGLRHSFATDMLSAGAGLREVQEMLGHKNIATTQIYTHVTNPQLKKVHEKYHSGNK